MRPRFIVLGKLAYIHAPLKTTEEIAELT